MTQAILTNTESYGEAVKTNEVKARLIELLALAGIRVNGTRPRDIQIHDEAFYRLALFQGSIGVGESYMKKIWDCNQPDEFSHRILRASLVEKIKMNPALLLNVFLSWVFNYQTRAFKAVQKHYDIDNTLFQYMLDKRMAYSCGYWKNASTLDQAQENKLDLICQKLNLTKGMHILDIGCGLGNFAKFAAEKYAIKFTGITASRKQMELGHCAAACPLIFISWIIATWKGSLIILFQ